MMLFIDWEMIEWVAFLYIMCMVGMMGFALGAFLI